MRGALVGHIIGGPADPDYDGAVLTADVAVGDTVLHVDDTADFDEDASQRDAVLLLGVDLGADNTPDVTTGTALAYTTCDDNTQTVTLAAPSTVTASSGDRIYLQDPVSGSLVGRTEVEVAIDNGDQTGDALAAYVDVSLLDSVGDVDLTDLAVDLDDDDDGLLYVAGFPGLVVRNGAVKFMQDSTTAPGSGGSVTLNLTYVPVVNSEHLYWSGIYQPGSQWTRDRWTVTIPDASGYFASGDELVMEYAYRDPATKPPLVYSGPTWNAHTGTWSSYPTSFLTSQALPVGTQVGDLLVAVAVGEGGHSISDARMTTIATDTNMSIAVGYATTLSALSCHVGGVNFPIDQFAGLEIIAVRGTNDGVAYDPTRIAVSHVGGHAALGTIFGAGHGAILAVASGVINGITLDMATYCPGYTDWGGQSHTAILGNFGYSSSNSPAAQNGPTNTTTLTAVIGLK